MAQELKVFGMDDPEVGDEYEMYKVSEVDAVLAEKDKVIAHQKYKRCLAMAKWCECRWADISTQYYKSVLYRKWQLRWLELAEKFKEAK